MNRTPTSAVPFAGLLAMSIAIAQTASPPTSAVPSADTPSGEAPKTAEPARRDGGRDARLCLEFPTNVQIIACAEKYRTRKRNR